MRIKKTLAALAAMTGALSMAGAAHAVVFQSTFQGATFTVTPVSSTEFTFNISDPTGLSGDWSTATVLDAFAFNNNILTDPTAVTTLTANGTAFETGGLDSSGCNTHGAFFCFDLDPSVALASSMTFDIKVTGTTFSFSNTNAPDLKIAWATSAESGTDTPGTTDNDPAVGNLFSQSLSVAVPEPATWALMLFGVGAIGAAMRSSRRSALATA